MVNGMENEVSEKERFENKKKFVRKKVIYLRKEASTRCHIGSRNKNKEEIKIRNKTTRM